MTGTPTDQGTESPKSTRQRMTPIQLLSIIAGGWTLFAFIDEVTPAKAFGKLRSWVDAYNFFVEKYIGSLYEWIDISWLSVSSLERHMLVIWFVVLSGFIRTITINDGPDDSGLLTKIGAGAMLLFIAISPISTLLLYSEIASLATLSGVLLSVFLLLILETAGRQSFDDMQEWEQSVLIAPAIPFMFGMIPAVILMSVVFALCNLLMGNGFGFGEDDSKSKAKKTTSSDPISLSDLRRFSMQVGWSAIALLVIVFFNYTLFRFI